MPLIQEELKAQTTEAFNQSQGFKSNQSTNAFSTNSQFNQNQFSEPQPKGLISLPPALMQIIP